MVSRGFLGLLRFSPAFAVGLFVVAVGCGRSELDGDLGRSGDAGGAAGHDGAAGHGGAGGAAGGSAGAGGNGGAAGGASDGGARDGSVMQKDAPAADAPPPLTCGTMSCDVTKESCCLGFGPGGPTSTCIPKGSPCLGSSFSCDQKSDCASGETCCLTFGGGGGMPRPPSATCVAESMCMGRRNAILCATDADCPMTAPSCCTQTIFMTSFSACAPGC